MTQAPAATRLPKPLHPFLIGPAAALLVAAFATDVIYSRTLLSQWEDFSIWLLTGGLVLAALSGIALLLDVALRRLQAINWRRFAILAAAALLSLLNAFVHSRDGYTAIVPQGLTLSAIVTLLLVAAGWRGWSLAVARPSSPASFQGARS